LTEIFFEPMNMFKVPEVTAAKPRPAPFIRPAILVFIVALVVGAAVVAWLAMRRLEDARTAARKEAQARASMLEMQFQQAISAAEILEVYGKQSGGGIPGFGGIAKGLLTTRPALAAIELQPAGVVRDVFPRNGNERLIGLNVRTDPDQGLGVATTIQRRALTILGPLPMGGGQGIVARAPLFVRARNGVESFWGLIAVSIRFQDAFGWARVDDLYRSGYNYAFFPSSADLRKATPLLWRGDVRVASAVQQTVRAGNLEFRLALEPRGGWVDIWSVGWQAFLALFLAGLLCAVVNLFDSKRSLEEALDETRERLTQETRAAGQAQQEVRAAKDGQSRAQADLERSAASLKEAEARHVETQTMTEQSLHKSRQEVESLREEMVNQRKTSEDLQLRLDGMGREKQELTLAQEKEKQAASIQQDAAKEEIKRLAARLDGITQELKVSTLQAELRGNRDAAALKELQNQLETAHRSFATASIAQAKQVNQLEAEAQKLKTRLGEFEGLEKRALGLEATLDQVRADLTAAQVERDHLKQLHAESLQAPKEAAFLAASPAPSPEPAISQVEEISGGASRQAEPNQKQEVNPAGEVKIPAADLPVSEPPESTEPLPLSVESSEESEPQAIGKASDPMTTAVETQPESGPASKPVRRKKARPDNQMDFFAAPREEQEPVQVESNPEYVGESVAQESSSPGRETPGSSSEVAEHPEASEPAPGIAPAAEMSQSAPETEGEVVPVELTDPRKTARHTAANAEVAAIASRETEEPLDMPVIEGLVAADGLAWADGNRRKYLDKLRHFSEVHGLAAIKIRNALERGEPEEANRLVRALKSDAGEVGAVAVNGAAAALERAVHDRYEPGEIELLWAEMDTALSALVRDLKLVFKPAEPKPAAPRASQAVPVNLSNLRKAVGAIVPLLTDGDPGAKDCWRDNRATFRSAFSHEEGYLDFERCVRAGEFSNALETLKRALKKHNISV